MEENKYILFAGANYYPMGGVDDFIAFGTIDELKALFEADKAKAHLEWGQIVEHETMTLALSYDRNKWYKPE